LDLREYRWIVPLWLVIKLRSSMCFKNISRNHSIPADICMKSGKKAFEILSFCDKVCVKLNIKHILYHRRYGREHHIQNI